MKKLFILSGAVLFISCKKVNRSAAPQTGESVDTVHSVETATAINKDKNTIRSRFPAPAGYTWTTEMPDTFDAYIENFPLKNYGSAIFKYDRTPIATQDLHEAVFEIDTGSKDLQQCADALIRLRAEYLFKNNKFDEIKFHFTSGDLMTWDDYREGVRPVINGNTVHFRNSEKPDQSYANFRKYLDLIFTYAGTISLYRETFPVLKTNELKSGDLLITAGSPGHIVFIAGVSENRKGERLFLLGQGFTPAQSIHLLKNPYNKTISPWYQLDVNADETKTARYIFKPTNFRKF